MNEFEISAMGKEEIVERGDSSFAMHSRSNVVYARSRIAELEMENSRLHRLIAELLLKNQELRKED